jgi:hypothetical protein
VFPSPDPKKYQSGETDVTGRISKIGDGGVRTALYEAANAILTRSANLKLRSSEALLRDGPAIAHPRSSNSARSRGTPDNRKQEFSRLEVRNRRLITSGRPAPIWSSLADIGLA